jgi:pyruvate/2-oxoglutarate/acetoin dehydrogenase E1 component
MTGPRVVADLNRALVELAAADERLYFLGEDIADPYGGAFKVTSGLSTAFPDRVLSTPISEGAIVGVASGLALRGNRVIAEVMFGDFIGLCFDQLVNFATKSVSMYGARLTVPLVIRCPVGGGRGYGPTHSQNLTKHFVGVPNLTLFELSPFHDNRAVLERMLGLGEPCMFVEDKGLYAERKPTDGVVDDIFRYGFVGGHAVVDVAGQDDADFLLIAPGGLAGRAVAAMRSALLERDLVGRLVVPSQLYPFDLDSLLPFVRAAGLVCVAEDGVAGGNWGREVAGQITEAAWRDLRAPVRLVHPPCSVIPTARHLETEWAVGAHEIHEAVVWLVTS